MNINNISKYDLAYLAGFIDGEGCLAINKRKHKNKFGEWTGYSAYLDLANVNLEVMEFIKNKFCISSKIYENQGKGNRKMAYRLRMNKEEAQKIISMIQEFLIVKKNQAKIFLDFCEDSKNVEKREILWEQMKKLNHRGL